MSDQELVLKQDFSREDIETLKRSYCKDATDSELKLFVKVCQRTGLDPFARQIFAVKRWDNNEKKFVMSSQTSIDGYRLTASRTGKYEGQLGPFWCGDDGVWKDVWLTAAAPACSKVGVLHKDFKEPLWGVARWGAYVQLTKEKQVNSMWQKMGDLMLAKCAEALALRKAFPAELSGLYTQEEMSQATPELSHPLPSEEPQKVIAPVVTDDTKQQLMKELTSLIREKGIALDIVKEFTKGKFGIEKAIDLTIEELEKTIDFVIQFSRPEENKHAGPSPWEAEIDPRIVK